MFSDTFALRAELDGERFERENLEGGLREQLEQEQQACGALQVALAATAEAGAEAAALSPASSKVDDGVLAEVQTQLSAAEQALAGKGEEFSMLEEFNTELERLLTVEKQTVESQRVALDAHVNRAAGDQEKTVQLQKLLEALKAEEEFAAEAGAEQEAELQGLRKQLRARDEAHAASLQDLHNRLRASKETHAAGLQSQQSQLQQIQQSAESQLQRADGLQAQLDAANSTAAIEREVLRSSLEDKATDALAERAAALADRDSASRLHIETKTENATALAEKADEILMLQEFNAELESQLGSLSAQVAGLESKSLDAPPESELSADRRARDEAHARAIEQKVDEAAMAMELYEDSHAKLVELQGALEVERVASEGLRAEQAAQTAERAARLARLQTSGAAAPVAAPTPAPAPAPPPPNRLLFCFSSGTPALPLQEDVLPTVVPTSLSVA